ncbi:LuxR family maltose regulon positive regulatory protein [Streptacidiphilus sp. MAP12-33]|uniref:LuxR C-terminal-related transcriptional regulator n=1 Tax=Streptacidiphilus sp. MAP12-33 TaxID=3156266 RepID=UPI0035143FEB
MPRRSAEGGPGSLRLIGRDDLVAALDRAATGKVAIVTAPAGSGKSTLLRAWADRLGGSERLAFVQVQRDRQDAQIFWLALLNAVRGLSGDAAGKAEPLTASPNFSDAAAVDRVLVELAELDELDELARVTGRAGPAGRVCLVIDDLHELASPDTFAELTRLLTSLPDGVHAVLATRRDLPLRLHRLRLAGELAELRAADLQFSTDETRALLDSAGVTLSDAAVDRLHERTEGWAAGLRLAVISLTGHPDPERFVADFTGSNRTVAEYLVAEMLERQPQEVQDLLLRTSVLQRVNGELADRLTGRPGSERILLDLEDANAFVVSLDAERTWFRYHHLFADLLRLELRRTRSDEVPGLHREAADWLAGHGQAVEAVRHLQAAGAWAEAATMLGVRSFGMMLDGQEETMQALLEAFPKRSGADFPELSIVRTMVDLLHGRLDDAAAHLTVTDACIAAEPEDRRRRLGAALNALNLVLARRRGDLAGALHYAELLDSDTGGSDEEIVLSSELRVLALLNLGTVEAWALGVSDGERHLQEGADLARKIGRPYLEVACLAQLGFATKLSRFGASRTICEQAIALADAHGWGAAPIVAPALVTLACSMVWRGEFDDAERTLSRAEAVLRTDSGPGIGTLLHLVTGMLHAGRGQESEAAEEFAKAHDLQDRLTHPHALSGNVTGWLLATRARLGAVADARSAVESLSGSQADSGEANNARAVICLAEGDPAGALAAAATVVSAGAPTGFVGTEVEAQLLTALAHRALGDQRRAEQAVERALALAEPERLILPFVTTGARDLMATMPRGRSSHAALLTDILDVVQGVSLTAATSGLTAGQELSPTELRVLRYLPTNLSRPEIAGELSISVNTVNTHVRNIYAKLRAADRSSAVQRARELHLLAGVAGR